MSRPGESIPGGSYQSLMSERRMRFPYGIGQFPRRVFCLLVIVLIQIQSGCYTLSEFRNQKYQESQQLSQMAEMAEENRDFEQAARFWKKAGRLKNDDGECMLRCAENHCLNNQHSDAIEILHQAISANPEKVELQLRLARIQMEAGNRVQAQDTLETLLNQSPEITEAIMMLSEIAVMQKRFDLQGELYHRVLSVNPDHVTAQLLLANWYIRNNKDEQAEILLRSTLVSPNATPEQIVEAKWNIGIIHGRKEEWRKAIAVLSSVIDQKKNVTPKDWYRLAFACYQDHQIPECREFLIKAIELDPTYSNAVQMQAKLRSGTGHSMEIVSLKPITKGFEAPAFWNG